MSGTTVSFEELSREIDDFDAKFPPTSLWGGNGSLLEDDAAILEELNGTWMQQVR